jgi:hypothetical protein
LERVRPIARVSFSRNKKLACAIQMMSLNCFGELCTILSRFNLSKKNWENILMSFRRKDAVFFRQPFGKGCASKPIPRNSQKQKQKNLFLIRFARFVWSHQKKLWCS